jgi:putative transcriptional regulator
MVGGRVKQYRRWRKMRQEALAHAMGVPLSTISKIERGARKVSLEEAVRLAHILRVSLEDLAGIPGCIGPPDGAGLLATECARKIREAEAALHAASALAQRLDGTLSVSS